jgi:hypothetical protein
MNSLTKVHVTIGNGKMKNIPSISVSSLTNDFCQLMSKIKGSVCGVCYSNRLSKFRKNLEVKLLHNSALLSEKLLTDRELPTFNNRYVRFNSFGELINDIHMENLIAIAKKNPYTNFGLWTKRTDIVLKYDKIPNIKYIFSVSKIDGECTDKKVLDYFDKTFTAVPTKDNANCHGACIDCMLCYTDNDVKVIRERKK